MQEEKKKSLAKETKPKKPSSPTTKPKEKKEMKEMPLELTQKEKEMLAKEDRKDKAVTANLLRPKQQTYVAITKSAIRKTPSKHAPMVRVVQKGGYIEVLDKDSGWLVLEDGYIMEELAKKA